jgi:hypothetical protein
LKEARFPFPRSPQVQSGVRTTDETSGMYDGLTTRYTFSCPVRGEARVGLSSFRELRRLPGASHPAVYSVRFACPCGEDHPGLVSHNELDWAPLGLDAGRFLNLMTARLDECARELADLAAHRIQSGEWPWSFFCSPEGRPRPVFPSSFWLLAPDRGGESLGLAVRCPACSGVSINLVSHAHVDLPFHHDVRVGVVAHLFDADALRTLEEFREELGLAAFDARRLELE